MAEPLLIPIRHLQSCDVQGETRWTGQVTLPGHTPRNVLVLRVKGALLAVRNRCPHHGVAMTRGKLNEEACTLECPSHGWELPLDGGDLAPLPVVEQETGLAVFYGSR